MERFFANGTTALSAALTALGCRHRDVAIPACVCPSVPAAVLASGNRPICVDIEPVSLGLCPSAMAAAGRDWGAVIAVHAYGVPCQIGEIATYCQQNNIPLIEDCAQAEGAQCDGRLVGGWGDIAIFSYGTGKILDLKGGGSAITTNPALAVALDAIARTLPESVDHHAADALSSLYKFFYNSFFPDRLEPYRFLFPRVMAESGQRQLGRADPDHIARIVANRAILPDLIAARRSKADLYARTLGHHPAITLLPTPTGAVPWRFNIALPPQHRDRIFRQLLRHGFRISTWYPPLSLFLGPDFAAGDLPIGTWLGQVIVNLPLDEATGAPDILTLCEALTEMLE